MLIERRSSARDATSFPVGSAVVARPATCARSLAGVVVDTWGAHVVVVRVGGLEVAVDVEDCETSRPHGAIRSETASRAAG